MKFFRHSALFAASLTAVGCIGSEKEGAYTAFLAVAAAPLQDIQPGAAIPADPCDHKLTGDETFRVLGADVLVAFRNGAPVCTDTLASIESELRQIGATSAAASLRNQYEARSLSLSMQGMPVSGEAAGDPNPQPARAGDPNPQPARAGDPNPQPAAGDPNPQPAIAAGDPNPQPAGPVATPVTVAGTATDSTTL